MHLTALILVFLMAIPSVYRGFTVFKVRTKNLSDAEKNKELAKKALKQYNDVVYGATQGENGSFGEGSLKQVSSELSLLNLNRGRVWGDCVVSDNSDDGFSLTFQNPIIPQENGGGDGQRTELEPGELPTVGSEVFLFENMDAATVDASGTEIAIGLPGKYLGTAIVTSVNGDILEFNKKDVVGQFADDAVVQVFDKPSSDFHGIMAQAMEMEIGRDKLPTIQEFRDRFQKDFSPEKLGLKEDDPKYLKILDEFSFDRRKIEDINRFLTQNGRPEISLSPDNIFVEMKVIKDISKDVDGDTSVYDGGLFSAGGELNVDALKTQDKSGKVVIPASKEGEDVIIMAPERVAILGYTKPDGTDVKSYEEQGLATPIGRYYYRTLRNYTAEILDIQRSTEFFKNQTTIIQQTAKLNKEAEADTEKQIETMENYYNNLRSDDMALKADRKLAIQYGELLTTRISNLRRQIRENYLRMSHINSETHKMNEKWSLEKKQVEGSFN